MVKALNITLDESKKPVVSVAVSDDNLGNLLSINPSELSGETQLASASPSLSVKLEKQNEVIENVAAQQANSTAPERKVKESYKEVVAEPSESIANLVQAAKQKITNVVEKANSLRATSNNEEVESDVKGDVDAVVSNATSATSKPVNENPISRKIKENNIADTADLQKVENVAEVVPVQEDSAADIAKQLKTADIEPVMDSDEAQVSRPSAGASAGTHMAQGFDFDNPRSNKTTPSSR